MIRLGFCSRMAWGVLPTAVGGSVTGSAVGGGMDVCDTRVLLIHRHQDVFLDNLPVRLAGHGIKRDLAKITCRDEII